MTEIVQPIPARLKNVAVGGHVAGAEDIDAGNGKNQAEVNTSVDSRLDAIEEEIGGGGGGTGDSLSERVTTLEEDVSDIETAIGDDNTSGSVKGRIKAIEDSVGANGGIAELDNNGKVPSSQLPSMNYVPNSEKGANGGVATLDNSGKVPSSQLPSYVDDVIDLLDIAETAPEHCAEGDKYYNSTSKKIFTATGTDTWGGTGADPENGKIYITLDDNKEYRWSGTMMAEISESLALGETASTAFAGNRGVAIEGKIPSAASDSNKLVDSASMQSALSSKANTSDVNTALAGKANSSDVYTKTQIDNQYYTVAEGEQLESDVQSAIAAQDDEIDRRMDAQDTTISNALATQQAKLETLDGHDVIPVPSVPSSGEPNKVYRVYGTTSYTDYMFKAGALTTPIPIATYQMPGIDSAPTVGSDNLVKSGGMYDSLYHTGNVTPGYLEQSMDNRIIANNDWLVSDYISVPSGKRIVIYVLNTNIHAEAAAVLEYDSNKNVLGFKRVGGYTNNSYSFTTNASTSYIRVSYPKDAEFVSVYWAYLVSGPYQNYHKDDIVVLYTRERTFLKLTNVMYDVFRSDSTAYKVVNGTITEYSWQGTLYMKMDVKAGDIVVFPRGYYNDSELYPPFLKVNADGSLTAVPSILGGLGFKADADATYIAFGFSFYDSEGCYVYTHDVTKYDPSDDKIWYDTTLTLDFPDFNGNKIYNLYTDIPKGEYINVKMEILNGTVEYVLLTLGGFQYRNNSLDEYGLPYRLQDNIGVMPVLCRMAASSLKVRFTFHSTIKNIPLTMTPLLLDDGVKVIEKINSRAVTKRLQFVHFTDPHGSLDDLLMDYVDGSSADFSVITGDMIGDNITSPFYADYLVTKQKPCYAVMGNHDVWQATSLQERFDKYIAPLNNHNGLSLNTKTYYSVNYTEKGVKCIILDQWDALEVCETNVGFNGAGYNMSDEQVAWFINELTDALSNGLDVVVFVHEPPLSSRVIDTIDGWNDCNMFAFGQNGDFLAELIDAFMHIGESGVYDVTNPQTNTSFTGEFEGYGQFVGWFAGHKHLGIYGYPVEHDRQFYAISARPYAPGYIYDGRIGIPIRGSQASINHVVIDAENKVVSFIRIGIKDTKYGVEAKPFSINYGNNRGL